MPAPLQALKACAAQLSAALGSEAAAAHRLMEMTKKGSVKIASVMEVSQPFIRAVVSCYACCMSTVSSLLFELTSSFKTQGVWCVPRRYPGARHRQGHAAAQAKARDLSQQFLAWKALLRCPALRVRRACRSDPHWFSCRANRGVTLDREQWRKLESFLQKTSL